MIHIVTRWLLLGLPEQDQKLSYNTCIASMLENNVLFSSSAARLASFPMRFFDILPYFCWWMLPLIDVDGRYFQKHLY